MSPEEFNSQGTSISNALIEAGMGKDTIDKLHNKRTIVIEENKRFNCGRVTAFAVHIGTASGRVWACVENGDLIDEDGRGLGQAKRIFNSPETPVQFLPSNNWPTSIRNDVQGLLRHELFALVRLDVYRWAEVRKAKSATLAIVPDLKALVKAMKLYSSHNKLKVEDPKGPDIKRKSNPSGIQPRGSLQSVEKEDKSDSYMNDRHLKDRSGSVSTDSESEGDVNDYFMDYERAEEVEYASSGVLLDALGQKLMSALPHFSVYRLAQRQTENYLPVRLHIGECYDAKSRVLCRLWVYLFPTQQRKHAPHLDYIVGRPVRDQDIQLMANTRKEEIKGMNHQALCTELSNGTAKLLPLYRLFGNPTSEAELQALIKYAFVLAAELHPAKLPDHLIPLNSTFIANLRKVCQILQFRSVDLKARNTNLPLRRVDIIPNRGSGISSQSARDAKMTGLHNLDKMPEDLLKNLEGSSPVRAARSERRSGDRLPEDGAYIAEENSPRRKVERVHQGVNRAFSPNSSAEMMDADDLIKSNADRDSPEPRKRSKDGGDDPAGVRIRKPASAASQSGATTTSAAKAGSGLSVSRSILISLVRRPKAPKPKPASEVRPKHRKEHILRNLEILSKNRKVLRGRIIKTRSAYNRNANRLRRATHREEKLLSRSDRLIDRILHVSDRQEKYIEKLSALISTQDDPAEDEADGAEQ
ncbi:hypothetical protein HBI56_229720 [Parastagonospora nodorum]|nr:hypothetical protein HBH49_107680 [Parastagonospora nodorum]KAH4127186.1 hypothetical protein HBH47_046000 [Parastagonospora nodorum]KAH4252370.1 hypothetical protein HBI03_211880 [Parastagonospora nodorum]KAH4259219.1 hypothetical protein HBI04_214220 [Parastagonospora nodorum]KAH5157203.1 hypothetical protein HBH69_087390 [Parastagonospora nodorum]